MVFARPLEIYHGVHTDTLDVARPVRTTIGTEQPCPGMHVDGRDLVLSTGARIPLDGGVVMLYVLKD